MENLKRTKIVCTLGPTSDKKPIIKRLIKAGMNVSRLNFSHNVHSYHLKVMKMVRAAAMECAEPVAILQDLQGPRIRLGELSETGINLKNKSRVILTTADSTDGKKIPVTYKKMHEDVKAGERILISDGLIELKVKSVQKKDIICVVINGGKIFSHKGINLPDTNVRIEALSEKDKEDLLFGVKNKVDFVALSFVRTAKDIYNLRKLIEKYERQLKIKATSPIRIIAKIERREAIENIDEILASADGLMVARGDLGIEMPAEEIPLLQKMLIDKCLHAAKPVIVATQMLESMINNPRPTRAEVSDVANAVIDHTDAIMLSGETANGKFPVEAVEYMTKIAINTEKSTYDDFVLQEKVNQITPANDAVAGVAKVLTEQANVKLILVASLSGHSGRVVSRYRPEKPIYVACDEHRVERQLNLNWGLKPFVLPACQTINSFIDQATNYLKRKKVVKKNDRITIVSGITMGKSGTTDFIEIKKI
ncbi:MAG: pyruvate kinase [Patescibacteria group bacterium]